MCGDGMRRRLLLLLASAALTASLAVPAFAADGQRFALKLGSTFTITGRTGSVQGTTRAVGAVVLSGRWGAGAWHVITTTRTDKAGRYRLEVTPHRRGDLTLRIAPPDHPPRRYVLHVV
jgi:hypothetical protein